MSFNEFELLEVADDIEPGDALSVEDTDTGEEFSMQYVKKDSISVWLKKSNALYKFCQRTLEHSGDESWVILGKE